MKRFFALVGLSLFSCGLQAQVVDATVCEILKNPQSFDGKTVRIKGTVAAGFDQFVVKGSGCGHYVNDIWLSYPEGTKGKAGPVALVQLQPARNFTGKVATTARTPVTLDKSKDFKQFDSLLSTPRKGAGMCLGCNRYEVNATVVGRLDGVADAGATRDAAGKIVGISGFGNMNVYNARLVLQSVSDVSPQEVDFSANDAITKGDTGSESGGPDASDPLAAGHKAALAFGAGNNLGAQIERAVAAFGKPKEQNGVTIGYATTNEAAASAEVLGTRDSPDGVLYNCNFNKNRLQGDALTRAVIHLGQHVADVRNPVAGSENPGPSDLEFNAWVTTVVDAIATGQKTLTLPGSYLAWNIAWPAADRNNNVNDALTKFISTEMLLSR